MTERLRVHAVVHGSVANGPGTRSVVWTQGCPLACAGCFNPQTHASGGSSLEVTDLAAELAARAQDGITLTGGEPFEQWDASLALVRQVRRLRHDVSVLAFTGFTLAELRRRHADADETLSVIDVLVAGRYVAHRPARHGLLGSANQQIRLLSSRHTPAEIDQVPATELIVHADGSVTVTGVDPVDLSSTARETQPT